MSSLIISFYNHHHNTFTSSPQTEERAQYDLILHTMTCSDLRDVQPLMDDLWSLRTSSTHSLHAMILNPATLHCDGLSLHSSVIMIPEHSMLKCCPSETVGAKCVYFNATVDVSLASMFSEEISTCFLWKNYPRQ